MVSVLWLQEEELFSQGITTLSGTWETMNIKEKLSPAIRSIRLLKGSHTPKNPQNHKLNPPTKQKPTTTKPKPNQINKKNTPKKPTKQPDSF